MMDGQSLNLTQQKLSSLRQLLPEAFAEDKVDWEKLRLTLGEHVHMNNERYTLNWAGKSEAFRALQEPSTRTLIPAKEESLHFDNTENIFIEGENLEVLKVLQKSYFGKVKMIYIDPPYNTGNDSFVYPDTFAETRNGYERRVGDKDEAGYMVRDGMFRKNSKENGQYHSNWLSMMCPRLFLAKTLLRDDGVIFVSIDDNEVHNLRLLMDEIFGEENFVNNFLWLHGKGKKNKNSRTLQQYTICYAKNIELLETWKIEIFKEYPSDNPDNDERGEWFSGSISFSEQRSNKNHSNYYEITSPSGKVWTRQWQCPKEEMNEYLSDNRIFWGEPPEYKNVPRLKIFPTNDEIIPPNILDEVGNTRSAQNELDNTLETKDIGKEVNPKPTKLISTLCQISTNPNDIILDFFAGSGTTAHAVMALNAEDGGKRRCISVQLPEPCDEKSEAYKAGYHTIADIAKERIRRAAHKVQQTVDASPPLSPTKATHDSTPDLGFKAFKLSDSNFKQWQDRLVNNIEALQRHMEEHIDPITETATPENMMYELLLKNGKDLNSVVEYKHQCYYINDTELVFMLETITQEMITTIIQQRPKKVIALDRLFEHCDQLKTNTVLQMQDAGIEFKTI